MTYHDGGPAYRRFIRLPMQPYIEAISRTTAQTLQKLTIKVCWEVNDEMLRLNRLPNLKHLRMNVDVLFGSLLPERSTIQEPSLGTVLPPSLETLCTRLVADSKPMMSLYAIVRELARKRDLLFPVLREVTCTYVGFLYFPELENILTAMTDVCARAGIEIIFNDARYFTGPDLSSFAEDSDSFEGDWRTVEDALTACGPLRKTRYI